MRYTYSTYSKAVSTEIGMYKSIAAQLVLKYSSNAYTIYFQLVMDTSLDGLHMSKRARYIFPLPTAI